MAYLIREERIAQFILKWRFLGVFLPIFLCVITLFFIRDIKVETQQIDFIPTYHHFISVQQSLNDIFGGLNRVNIAIEAKKGDILQPAILKQVEAIAEEIQLLDEVNPRRISSLFAQSVKHIEIKPDGFSIHRLLRNIPQTQEALASLKQKIEHNPLVYGPLVAKDFKATLIQADFHEDIPAQQIYAKVKNIIKPYQGKGIKIYLSGRPILEGYIDAHLSAILNVFAVALVIIFSLLFWAFRKKRGFLLPLLAGSMSVTLSLAVVSLFHLRLNPFTILLPFLIFILAVSHSIQFMERYFEESRVQTDKHHVAYRVLLSLLSPIRASVFTDVLGFASLILIPIPAMQSIAVLGSLGVLSIFLTVVAFLPSCFAILPLPRFKAIFNNNNNNLGFTATILKRFTSLWQKKWRMYLMLTFFICLFAVAIYGVKHIEIGENEPGTSILYRSAPYNIAERKITTYFSGSNPYYVLIKGKEPEALLKAEAMKEIDALGGYLRHNLKEAGYGLSIADYVKLMNLAIEQRFKVPAKDKTIGEYIFLYESNAFPGEFSAFISPNHQFANLRLDLKDCRTTTIERVVNLTKKWVVNFNQSPWLEFDFAGGLIGILGATNDVVKKRLVGNMAVLCLLIFIRVVLALRSFSGGLILFIPLVFSIALTFGSFGLFHIPFTVAALPVAAMGTGLGIDYSIYLASRIKEEREKGTSLKAAINQAVLTCGKAVFFTGSILTIGLWSWLWSNLKLQAELGGTLGFLLFINMLSALIVLPIFILVLKPKFLMKEEEK
jgi:hypothetical protein